MLRILLLVVPFCALAWGRAAHADEPLDTGPLLAGVRRLATPGAPGVVVALRDPAEPVIVGGSSGGLRAAVVAASRWGRGRVVAFAHNAYLHAEAMDDGDTGRFVLNAVQWCAPHTPRADVRVGVAGTDLSAWLVAQGLRGARALGNDYAARLGEIDVLVLDHSEFTAKESGALAAFVTAGGGLLIAQTGWGWQQIHHGASMLEHPPSQLLAPAGLAWSDQFAEPTDGDFFAAGERPAPLVQFSRAFEALFPRGGDPPSSDPQAGASVAIGLRLLPPTDSTFLPRVRALLAQRRDALNPSDAHPLRSDQPAERALLAYQVALLNDTSGPLAPGFAAHPSAAAFPGAVDARAPRETVQRTIDLGVPGWHSLGLYVPPGGGVSVVANAWSRRPVNDLTLQVGSHTDELWHLGAWRRVPAIVLRAKFKGSTSLATPYGGLVYIDVGSRHPGQTVTIQVTGVVAAPLFDARTTTNDAWQASVRGAPGPWAEINTGKVILTVPSAVAREVNDPGALAQHWNRVLDAAAEFVGRPTARERPERFVADVQISAGYMHSGYPIMTHLDAAPDMVSLSELRQGTWGLYHELGHNHQGSEWTFDGTGEVTNNVIVLYILETVCGRPPCTGHPAIDNRDERRARTRAHLAAGAPFEAGKSDPFLALEMYMQLREAFGWEPFKKVFAEYRALPVGEGPRDDDEKRDQWMVRISRATGHDLGPFFQRWGVPTSDAARAVVANLPAWMPDDLKP